MNCEELVGILRRYDVPFDHPAVKAAFEDEQSSPSLADWAKLHLTPDTLLTVDDLLQYSTLEKSGKVDQLAASADLATVQSFSDRELRDAIEELDRSTETISKQTEALTQQQDALTRLMRGKAKESEGRSALELKHAQAWELDRKTSASDVEALAQNMDMRISELEQQGGAQSDVLRQTVNSMLASDDKLFSSLQKLGWELETGDPEEKEVENKLRDICARLIKYTVEAIRTRLDRLYLESIATASSAATKDRAQGEDVSALQEELESLYAEILPVAQMSTEEQYLGPALKSLNARNGKSLARSAHAADYIHECLDYLLCRIEKMSSRIEIFQAHRAASHKLVAAAKTELSAQVEPVRKKERRPTVGSSPTRRRKSSTHGTPMSMARGRSTSRSRRRSSGAGAHSDEPPLEQLLRQLALIMPGGDASTADADTISRQQTATLAATLADRTSKATDVARNVQESFEDAAAAQLKDAGVALQMLRDSLLAESPFGDVRLVDPEIEDSIGVLDQELEKVRARLEGVDAEIVKARGRKGRRDEIVHRWGR